MFHYSKSPGTFNNSPLKLETLMKNVLYLTHEVDKCVRMLKELTNSQNLQRQVDEYFDEGQKTGLEDTRDDND